MSGTLLRYSLELAGQVGYTPPATGTGQLAATDSAGTYAQSPIVAADAAARLGNPAAVKEGWLQFSPANQD